jgi:LPXTG-motif cell wall-anchored protein
LAKTTDAGTTVTVGQTINVDITWDTDDWDAVAPDGDLDRVADCVEVGGVVDTTLSTEEKPTDNDGLFEHQYVIPNVAPGTQICDRARLSGNPSGQNEETQKSNIVCFTVVAPPTTANAKVQKVIASGSTGSLLDWEFTLNVNGGAVEETKKTDANGVINFTTTLSQGDTYDIQEINVPLGWQSPGLSGCSGTVTGAQLGTTITCTATNAQQETRNASAKVQKVIASGSTGSLANWDFTLNVNGGGVEETKKTDANGVINFTTALNQGDTYEILEINVPAGWQSPGLSGCSGTVTGAQLGTTITCTATNAQTGGSCCVIVNNDGTLIVEKQTVPDGAAQAFSFSGAALGTGASLSDGQSTSRTVGPGIYTVSELQPDGWDLTSITCTDTSTGGAASTGDVASSTATFRVEANETVRCVFTNTEEPDEGSIVVIKQTLPNGSDEEFGFAGDLSGDISDGESLSATVDPGTYTVAEHASDGWELTDISCTDSDATGIGSSSNLNERSATFNVDPGETVTCEFTNSEIEVLPRPPIVRTPPEPKVLPKGPVLPFTGGDPSMLLTAAGALIALGGGLTLAGRRRRSR